MKKFMLVILLITSFLCLNAAEVVKGGLFSQQDLEKLQAFMLKSSYKSTVKESVIDAAAAVEIAMRSAKTFKPDVIDTIVRQLTIAGEAQVTKEKARTAMEDYLRNKLPSLRITDTLASESAISNLDNAIRLGFKIPDDWSLRQGVAIERAREAWQSQSPGESSEQIEQKLLEYIKDNFPSDYDTLVSNFAGTVTSGLEGAVSRIEEGASSLLGPKVALIGSGLALAGWGAKKAYDEWTGANVAEAKGG